MVDSNKQQEEVYLEQYNPNDYASPLVTVDTAVFSVIDQRLVCLLVKRAEHPHKGRWSLPGGFIDLGYDTDTTAAAKRKLIEKTGVKTPYLEQVVSVGNQTRDPRGWAMTVLYFALINYQSIKVEVQSVEDARWVDVEDALKESLAFDHHQLLSKAIERLRSRVTYTALPISLLPTTFTLTELQTMFEVVLGTTLEKKSFRRRVIAGQAVIETNQKTTGQHPAVLYRANKHSRDFTFPRPLETHAAKH